MTIIRVVMIISLISFLSHCQGNQIPSQKIVEIQPVAFDIIISHYSRVVALFVDEAHWESYVPLYEEEAGKLMAAEKDSKDILFAICNTSKDHSGILKKYGDSQSIKYVTQVKHYSLSLSDKPSLKSSFKTDFPAFYNKLESPAFPVFSKAELNEQIKQLSNSIVVFANSQAQIQHVHTIHRKIIDYLQLFKLRLITIKDQSETTLENPRIFIYQNSAQYSEYPQSAVNSLFNFTNGISKGELNDLVDFINIETIDLVSKLDNSNYFRVFGSQVNSQLLLVYREKDHQEKEISQIRTIFQQAAKQNKQNDLKYHRVLFAQASVQFLREYFADELLNDEETKYRIIHTKTQYSTFQLRKYDYKSSTVNKQMLLTFLEDVRMKKIDASYKSQPIPNEIENSKQKIRKIVGETFISEIFQQKDKSVAVLFIDSKDEGYKQILQKLDKFVSKYHDAFKNNLNFGIFDLAKNQHQLLTIKDAPELVLFERTNKKKPSFFQGQFTEEILKNWVNYEIKDLTIPQNYGQPILPIGGPASQPIPTVSDINKDL